MPTSSTAYAIYLRKSRADFEAEQSGSGETLARHRSILTKLAIHNHHLIGHIYQEIVSGETIADRPEVRALLQDVSAGKWQGVYVMEVERLARGDTMDQGLVAHAFKIAGTYIITPQKTYNPADPSDEEYFEFSLFMSRREYKTINRRMQGGRVQSAKEGKYIGSRPAYGYRKVKISGDKGYTLTIDVQESAIVQQVFDWYLHGIDGKPAGLVRIAAYLDDLHIPVGEQGTVWKPCRIHRMLTNPVYIGMIQWGKNKTERSMTSTGIAKKRVMHPQGQLFPGLHPAIVEEAIYNAVQDRLHQPRAHIPVRLDMEISNPLVGLLECSDCGHLMGGLPASGRQPAKVLCRSHNCPCVQSYRAAVEHVILDTLRSWISDSGVAVDPPDSQAMNAADLLEQSMLHLQADRDKAHKQLAKLQDLVEQEVYTVDQYNARYAVLQERLDDIDANTQRLRAEATASPRYCTYDELRPAIVHLLQHYGSASPAEQNNMLRSCISKVVYRKHVRGNTVRGVVHSSSNQFVVDVYPLVKT
ncbi:MAG: recombinase family protein [Clostridia bacterium]